MAYSQASEAILRHYIYRVAKDEIERRKVAKGREQVTLNDETTLEQAALKVASQFVNMQEALTENNPEKIKELVETDLTKDTMAVIQAVCLKLGGLGTKQGYEFLSTGKDDLRNSIDEQDEEENHSMKKDLKEFLFGSDLDAQAVEKRLAESLKGGIFFKLLNKNITLGTNQKIMAILFSPVLLLATVVFDFLNVVGYRNEYGLFSSIFEALADQQEMQARFDKGNPTAKASQLANSLSELYTAQAGLERAEEEQTPELREAGVRIAKATKDQKIEKLEAFGITEEKVSYILERRDGIGAFSKYTDAQRGKLQKGLLKILGRPNETSYETDPAVGRVPMNEGDKKAMVANMLGGKEDLSKITITQRHIFGIVKEVCNQTGKNIFDITGVDAGDLNAMRDNQALMTVLTEYSRALEENNGLIMGGQKPKHVGPALLDDPENKLTIQQSNPAVFKGVAFDQLTRILASISGVSQAVYEDRLKKEAEKYKALGSSAGVEAAQESTASGPSAEGPAAYVADAIDQSAIEALEKALMAANVNIKAKPEVVNGIQEQMRLLEETLSKLELGEEGPLETENTTTGEKITVNDKEEMKGILIEKSLSYAFDERVDEIGDVVQEFSGSSPGKERSLESLQGVLGRLKELNTFLDGPEKKTLNDVSNCFSGEAGAKKEFNPAHVSPSAGAKPR